MLQGLRRGRPFSLMRLGLGKGRPCPEGRKMAAECADEEEGGGRHSTCRDGLRQTGGETGPVGGAAGHAWQKARQEMLGGARAPFSFSDQ